MVIVLTGDHGEELGDGIPLHSLRVRVALSQPGGGLLSAPARMLAGSTRGSCCCRTRTGRAVKLMT